MKRYPVLSAHLYPTLTRVLAGTPADFSTLKKGSKLWFEGRGKATVFQVKDGKVWVTVPMTPEEMIEERRARPHAYSRSRSTTWTLTPDNMQGAQVYEGQVIEKKPSFGKDAHSQKGLETMAEMNTSPKDWELTPIRYEESVVMEMRRVTCPKCNGTEMFKDGEKYVPCDNCDLIDGSKFTRSGMVKQLVPTKVTYAIPEWLPDVEFDSRFNLHAYGDSGGTWHCQLCNKKIKSSGMVPVQAKSPDGKSHGMWVGSDCAKKFFALSLKLKKDSELKVP